VNGCAPCGGDTSANAIATYVRSTADTGYLRDPAHTHITFCLPSGANKVGDPLKVTVSAPFNWLGALTSTGLPSGTSTISTTVTTRILEQPPDNNGHTLYTAAPC
jgi:hypothetical protein